jgi:hypothetical protein
MSASGSIVSKMSFSSDERNSLGLLKRFARQREGPHRFNQKRPQTFVAALWLEPRILRNESANRPGTGLHRRRLTKIRTLRRGPDEKIHAGC